MNWFCFLSVLIVNRFDNFFLEKGADADASLFFWFADHGHTLGSEGYLILTHTSQTPRYGKLRDKDYDRGDFVFLPLAIVFSSLAKT